MSYSLFGCRQEPTQTIEFSSDFIDASKDEIQLKLFNESPDTVFYYIGVVGIPDKGVDVPIASDIKSLGQEGSLVLMPLMPKSEFRKKLFKSQILKQSIDESIKRIRFYVTYFKERNFTSEEKTIIGKIL